MKKLLLPLLLLAFALAAYPQKSPFVTDHSHYLKLLNHAKDSIYQNVLAQFDEYIVQHPADYKTQMERCKLIQNAYYNSYDDENPNYEMAETCSRTLLAAFPDTPEVILYRLDFLYGDSAIAFLEKAEIKIRNDSARWKLYSWNIYKLLSENYSSGEKHNKAIHYARLATQENDSLDLTLEMARSYKATSDYPKAIDVLLSRMDSSNPSWELNLKGKLLLELGVPDKAIEAFHLASKDTSGWQDNGDLAQALIENGLPQEARIYLVKEIEKNSWNKSKGFQRLLEYDLTYSAADSAYSSYRHLVEEKFMNDPFGIYRLRLFLKAPLAAWSLADAGRILFLLLLVLFLFTVPYLWILPIFAGGVYLRSKGVVLQRAPFDWRLRHFWMACFLWLLVGVLANFLFNYQGIVASYFNDALGAENSPVINRNEADITLCYLLGCLLFTLFFLKKTDFTLFWPRLQRNGNAVMKGIGLALVLRFGLGLYSGILKVMGISLTSDGSSVLLSVTDSIVSLNQFYHPLIGFLFVVILVPFYEEILFRGIFLSACSRNMRFVLANMLQSITFAVIHLEWKLIPFFFAFGMIAGYQSNKTRSLITGTSMHMTNNLIAFLYILSIP